MVKRALILVALLMIAAGAFWFFRSAPPYDPELVHPRLRTLQSPYQVVRTGYYTDGGSIGIEIVDRDGRKELFAIPATMGKPNPYTKVFVGAMHKEKPEALEIADPEHTKRMLICILQDYPRRDAWDDFSLLLLRRSPVDSVRCRVHKWRGAYDL